MSSVSALSVEVVQAAVLAAIFLRLGRIGERTDRLQSQLEEAKGTIERLRERLRAIEDDPAER
jgi:hypothetical protein